MSTKATPTYTGANYPVHRIAALLRFLLNLNSCGVEQLAVHAGVRLPRTYYPRTMKGGNDGRSANHDHGYCP